MASPRVLAVDCGAGHIACGQISRDKSGRLTLDKFAFDAFNPDVALENDWSAMISQALSETAQREKFTGEVALGLPGHHTLAKFLKTPSVAADKRDKIVAFEAQQNIPYPLNEVVWDYQVVSEQGLDLELMLAAIKSDVLAGMCGAVSDAGLSVTSSHPSSLAVLDCFRYNYPEVTGTVLLVDIGARSTNLIFVDPARYSVSTIALAGNSVTQAIAEELKHDFTHCETIKLQVLSGSSDLADTSPARVAVRNAAASFIGKLHLELTRRIVNHRRQSGAEQPAAIYLTGGGSLLAELPTQLGEKLKIPAQRLDALRQVQVAGSAQAATPYSALLAGLVGLAVLPPKGVRPLSLLPAATASRLNFNKRQPIILAAVALGALALFPPTLQAFRANIAAKDHEQAVLSVAQPLENQKRKIQSNQEQLENARKEVEAIQSLAASKYNWINFFTDLQERLVKVEDVWLEKLSVQRATLGGEIAAETSPVFSPQGGPPPGILGGPGGPGGPPVGFAGGPGFTPGGGAAPAPAATEETKPIIRLQLSGRLLDRKNPLSKVSEDSYQRVKSLLKSFEESDFIEKVESERFDPNTPGILRFDFVLVVDPARPL
jgi:type IV pilus assembly protein PilM